MAEQYSKSEGVISKTEWRVHVGYRQKSGDRSTSQVDITGKWLAELGFQVEACVTLKILDGCLLLLPEPRNTTQLREEVTRYMQRKRGTEQIRQQIEALLTQLGS